MNVAENITNREPVYIVDGSSYIFRAFYAVAPLSTSSGFPTNALFGFARMLIKLLQQADSQHVVMVFDSGQKTFRNDLYSEYKANRSECPEDLRKQMPYFRTISSALGLPVLELPGYEADDIIGTLTKRLEVDGHQVILVTGDKDLMQLVSDRVSIWDTMKDKKYGPSEVTEKMGVPPELVVDYLGLTGDSSDNVPGLKGVGPKTAVQLLELYGGIEQILAAVSEIKENKSIRGRQKIAEQIEGNSDIVKLSKLLVTVDCNSPVRLKLQDQDIAFSELTPEQLTVAVTRTDPKDDELAKLVSELEFSSLFKNLSISPSSKSTLEKNYKLVMAQDFDGFRAQLLQQREVSIDLETTSLDVLEAEIVGVALCWDDVQAYYVPVAHKDCADQVSIELIISTLKPLLESSDIKKIGQNLKFDLGVFARYGIEMQGIGFDTMIASYLFNPDKSSHRLSILAQEELAYKMIEYSDIVGVDQTFADLPLKIALDYAAEDAHIAWLLYRKYKARIEDEELNRVFFELELPLIPVLSSMEREGILIDVDFLKDFSGELELRLSETQAELYKEAGVEFNINSPKQLSEVLYEKIGIPTKGLKKTKTGVSTDSSVLEQLQNQYSVPKLVLEYRALHKLKSTYVDVLPLQVSAITGRLHTKFNQTGTGTGRLSSSDPNLQNIPIQSEDGRKVRRAFIAKENHCLISADYSQIELRLLAHMSQDPAFIAAFKSDLDIHAATARDILALPEDHEISREERRIGKTINFGIIYGMSGFRLARDLGIPVGVATNYINNYFDHYAGVKKYFDQLEAQAESEGFVRTIYGRKRVIGTIDSGSRGQGYLRRVAINAPIQGSAADLVKLAMIRLSTLFNKEKLKIKLLLQIHDELIFECPVDVKGTALSMIRESMEAVVELLVPLKVDISAGQNWFEVH